MAPISQSFLLWTGVCCIHSPWIKAAPLTTWTNQIWKKWCSAGVQAQAFPDQQLLNFPSSTHSYHVTSKDSMERPGSSWAQASRWGSRYLRPSKAACPPAEYHQGTPTQHLMEQINCPVVSWALTTFLTHRSIDLKKKNQTVAKFFLIEVYLIKNVAIISAVQESDSVIYSFLNILFCYGCGVFFKAGIDTWKAEPSIWIHGGQKERLESLLLLQGGLHTWLGRIDTVEDIEYLFTGW